MKTPEIICFKKDAFGKPESCRLQEVKKGMTFLVLRKNVYGHLKGRWMVATEDGGKSSVPFKKPPVQYRVQTRAEMKYSVTALRRKRKERLERMSKIQRGEAIKSGR